MLLVVFLVSALFACYPAKDVVILRRAVSCVSPPAHRCIPVLPVIEWPMLFCPCLLGLFVLLGFALDRCEFFFGLHLKHYQDEHGIRSYSQTVCGRVSFCRPGVVSG